MSLAIDTRHGCKGGGGVAKGLIPVQQKASSSCCGAKLVPGGSDATGHTCADCKKPTTRVLAPRTAHWTCSCGKKRSQVVTEATDEGA
jgi:hypothetical protein